MTDTSEPTRPGASYWESWHTAYGDPLSALSRRLLTVQEQIEDFLEATRPRPVRVLSLCAGDGRDLLGVLARRDDSDRVTATLVELDPALAAAAEARAAGSAADVEVRVADAGDPRAYAGLPRADLVLLCGVLGNITDDDVRRTVTAMAALCAPGGRVVWTRSRREPDLTWAIRGWFAESGFREVAFVAIADSSASVGVAQREGDGVAALGAERLFTFVGEEGHRG